MSADGQSATRPTDLVGRAWRQVLDKRSFEADLPFDQAGGDSLRLLKFVFLLEEESGLRLPMQLCHLGLNPSGFADVVSLARRLGDRASAEPEGTVFLIPGMGGESQLEGGFVAACRPDLHVAIVDLPDWPDLIAPSLRMEDLLERTAAEIAARQPEGPLRLAGYSLGGHVAFGAARILAARGRDIAFFGILDTSTTPNPRPVPTGPAPVRALKSARWEIHNLSRAASRGLLSDKLGELTARFLCRQGRPGRLRLAARWRHARLPSSYSMYINIYLREVLQAGLLRRWQADERNASPPLEAPVVLFRSEDHTAAEPADLGWRRLCPDLRVVNVRGLHRTMLRAPHLDFLCAEFVRAAQETRVSATQLVA